MCRYVRQAPAQPPLGRGAERLLRAVHRQAGDLMVVVNVGDSRVVLGTTFNDDAITSSSSSSTRSLTCHGYYLADEPKVHFVLQPNQESSVLAKVYGGTCLMTNDVWENFFRHVWNVLSNDETMQS
ncbi:hypothetical protein ZEAMMB73_Zm00001d026073 [Zea mays]|uniref:Uncharacterized protein n=1 Tax=Zea mays TaxID=4577 RepID=A0A1D6JC33_MAIZE|nr:hypothetical protein ZEAMMB73_Zm00001d026073 [Zea mays]